MALAVGLMSGTSADGIDAALVRIDEAEPSARPVLLHSAGLPYPEPTRALLFDAFADRLTVSQLCVLNVALGELFAAAALQVIAEAGQSPGEVDFIASHGQTVWHQPEAVAVGEQAVTGTLQLGEPGVIAERTGCTVVADFRARDMAAGGEGAPLVPYFDHVVFSHPTRNRAAQNIGGIGNVTHLPAGAGLEGVLAFDTGPGNALIDLAAARATGSRQQQDTDGALARQGSADLALVERWLAHPYFQRQPPKSTGRELFTPAFVDEAWQSCPRPEDAVATLTEFTAASIARSYEQWLAPRGGVEEVIVSGGGVRNPALMASLRRRLATAAVLTSDELGVPGDAKEAMAFALLGYATLHGIPAGVPGATGARRATILGKIIPSRPTT